MNGYNNPELEDVLQDDELRRIATLLTSARAPEPPLDDAFRTGLRHQLMQQAWAMTERRESWWRRAFAPPGLAWAGAAAGVVLIAMAAVLWAGQSPSGPFQITATSPLDNNRSVALGQPILVSFNQPMDHPSTEAAVQITPATTVAFSWQGNTLAVTPTSGTLAPNTQYQVTIGPGAKTATQQELKQPQTITFVTQPPPTPAPAPTPRPTPTSTSPITGEKQLVGLSGGITAPVQWAPDSSAVYYVDAKGALSVVQVKDRTVTVIAPDGTSSAAISPAGDRLAYIRNGKIEVLTFVSGKTDELAVTPTPTLVGWMSTALAWTAADGVYTQSATGSKRIAAFPTSATITALSIAPSGTQVAYRQDQKLFLLDLQTGNSTQLGDSGATFLGWSPDGSFLMYGTANGIVIADLKGKTQATLPSGDPSWSRQDAVLIGTDTDLVQVRPDGSGSMPLSNGTYRSPVWAPNSSSFAFFRGGALWAAAAPAMPPQPTALDQANTVVTAFMDARLKGQADQASTWLDANGKQAYAADGMNLVISGDPKFSRYYVLTQELVSTDPDTTRFVVRLVLSHGKIDVSDFEEALVLVRDATSKQFLIDQATVGSHRNLGKGAEVVSVDVSSDTVKVTFDSDLDPGTISDGVLIVDAKGKPVDSIPTYANRVVTFTGLNLKAGAQYKLVVLPSVRDVAGHNIDGEYDLTLLGPTTKKGSEHKQAVPPFPIPIPAPTPTPTIQG